MSSILAVIAHRSSCRTFDGRPLSPAERFSVEGLLTGPAVGPFGNRVRFMLLDVSPAAPGTARLGTYGVIRDAPCFLAGAVAAGRGALEDFAFAFERVVLGLTAMGLATCWLAGSYRRSAFVDRLELADGEVLPAVSPVGHPAARPSLTDAIMRAGAGSARRRPWEALFSFGRKEAGAWEPCLEAVRLGPSATNAQPWRIAKEPGLPVFHLAIAGPAAARSKRRLDAGIAMCHFELAAGELGLAGRWNAPGTLPGAGRPVLPRGTVHVATWICA